MRYFCAFLLLSSSAMASTMPERIVLPVAPSDYFPILTETNSKCVESGYVTLAPGQDVGFHSTGSYEELVITLEGRGEMETKDLGRTAFAQGVVLHAFPNSEHDIWNTGDTVLRYIYVASDTRCGAAH
jgi:quercetin dioxygenase-like cupin family protein